MIAPAAVVGGCRTALRPALEDEVERGFGGTADVPEATGVQDIGQACLAGLGAERDSAGL